MNPAWNCVVDDIQDVMARGVALLPTVYFEFLEQLSERERTQNLCLLPSPRFELYHYRLESKVRQRIKALQTAA